MEDDSGSASGAGSRHAAMKGEPVEAADIAIAVLVVALIFWLLTRGINAAQRAGKAVKRAREPTPRVRPKYDFEPVTDRLSRRVKGVQGPAENRDAMLGFLSSRSGVEAYVEPKTVMHPLSIVLVAGDGEWKRFELADDAFVRELSRTRGVVVFDASRTGYPERMRRYKPPPPPAAESNPETTEPPPEVSDGET
jgi:hypothetical protein